MRTNLLLLAGQGKRFTEENYILPKPLISVDGVPMFILSAQHLPSAEKLIFVVAEYLRKYDVEAIITLNYETPFVPNFSPNTKHHSFL